LQQQPLSRIFLKENYKQDNANAVFIDKSFTSSDNKSQLASPTNLWRELEIQMKDLHRVVGMMIAITGH
jgi:hypothetical protein